MADFGSLDTGYDLKRLADVVNEFKSALSSIIDKDTGELLQADFSPEDPAMQSVLVAADGVSDAWESIQCVENQFIQRNATGALQSSLAQLNGLERIEAKASTVNLDATGTNGTIIPAGTIITDVPRSNEWAVYSDMTIAGGVASGTATCTVTGPVTANANTLTVIPAPIVGITSITNPSAAIVGNDLQSDKGLRNIQEVSRYPLGKTPEDGLIFKLEALEGVTYARVYQNRTESAALGIGARKRAIIIEGGDDQEIAQTIFDNTAAGIEYETTFPNTTTINIVDAQSTNYAISFIRPTEVTIYLHIKVFRTNVEIFPQSGFEEIIRQNIFDYTQNGAESLGIKDGFRDKGFGINDAVIRSRLFTPINKTNGAKIVELLLGTSPNPTAELDIPIGINEKSKFLNNANDIKVEVLN